MHVKNYPFVCFITYPYLFETPSQVDMYVIHVLYLHPSQKGERWWSIPFEHQVPSNHRDDESCDILGVWS